MESAKNFIGNHYIKLIIAFVAILLIIVIYKYFSGSGKGKKKSKKSKNYDEEDVEDEVAEIDNLIEEINRKQKTD